MTNVDFTFISDREGGQALTGYVPDPSGSRSGVTIATGFDLGARDAGDLLALGLPSGLRASLHPYLGLTGQSAVSALAKQPLTITQTDADLIDRASKANALTGLVASYNASSSVTFSSLPAQAQTVIASVAFQYGSLAIATPTFWKHVTSQDWAAAVSELRNFGDRYPTRRNLEADLLSPIVQQPAGTP